MRRTVAALFVDIERGPYARMEGVVPIGLPMDARMYEGPYPVVSHPPCAPWGAFSWRSVEHSKDGTKDCAVYAVRQVRALGGVLEHPAGSKLWKYMSMPRPGERPDRFGGYTISVRQVDWGHKAAKHTWLYIVGVDPRMIPPMPRSRTPTHVVESSVGRGPGTLPRLPKSERHITPPDFAEWLVELSRRSDLLR